MNIQFLLLKVFRAAVTMWLVVTAAFFILQLSGGPIEIMLGDDAEQDVVAYYRALYGLDQPLHIQYLRYFTGILSWELGYSLIDEQPVAEMISAQYASVRRRCNFH